MNTNIPRLTALAAAFLMLTSTASFALDSTWQGGSSTDWYDSANWTNGIPQLDGDLARFPIPANVTIPTGSNVNLRTLYTDALVEITIDPTATLNLANSGGTVIDSKAAWGLQ